MQKYGLSEIDDHQLRLSEMYITPNIERFEQAFYSFREVLDELWIHGKTNHLSNEKRCFLNERIKFEKKSIGTRNPTYPIGRCFNITQIAFAYIHRFELKNPVSVFYPLKEFIDQGGVFKIIWGEVRHEVFQTSMQMGNWYVDTANDTVFSYKPKVLKFKFDSDQNEFFEIKSLKHYLQIKTKYHDCQVFFNSVFPQVSILFPVLILYRNGVYEIDASKAVLDLSKNEGSDVANEVLLKRISSKKVAELRSKVLSNVLPPSLEMWLKQAIPTLHADADVNEALKAINVINFRFRTAPLFER